MMVYSEDQVPPSGRVASAYTTDTLEWTTDPHGHVDWCMYGPDGRPRVSGRWAREDYQRTIYGHMARGLYDRCVRTPQEAR